MEPCASGQRRRATTRRWGRGLLEAALRVATTRLRRCRGGITLRRLGLLQVNSRTNTRLLPDRRPRKGRGSLPLLPGLPWVNRATMRLRLVLRRASSKTRTRLPLDLPQLSRTNTRLPLGHRLRKALSNTLLPPGHHPFHRGTRTLLSPGHHPRSSLSSSPRLLGPHLSRPTHPQPVLLPNSKASTHPLRVPRRATRIHTHHLKDHRRRKIPNSTPLPLGILLPKTLHSTLHLPVRLLRMTTRRRRAPRRSQSPSTTGRRPSPTRPSSPRRPPSSTAGTAAPPATQRNKKRRVAPSGARTTRSLTPRLSALRRSPRWLTTTSSLCSRGASRVGCSACAMGPGIWRRTNARRTHV